jgi:hypothetical protein
MRPGQAGAQSSEGASTARPVNLEGDSPELVAFALLRYLAQLEQQNASRSGVVFDRNWLLDAYAECLDAVRGLRTRDEPEPAATPRQPARGSRRG